MRRYKPCSAPCRFCWDCCWSPGCSAESRIRADFVAAATARGVWKSIVDPWGWFLEGSNVLLYPSLIVLAAALVLQTFQEEDPLSLDGRRNH